MRCCSSLLGAVSSHRAVASIRRAEVLKSGVAHFIKLFLDLNTVRIYLDMQHYSFAIASLVFIGIGVCVNGYVGYHASEWFGSQYENGSRIDRVRWTLMGVFKIFPMSLAYQAMTSSDSKVVATPFPNKIIKYY